MWQPARAALRVPAFQQSTGKFLHVSRKTATQLGRWRRMRWRAINRRVLKRVETTVLLVVVHINSIVGG